MRKNNHYLTNSLCVISSTLLVLLLLAGCGNKSRESNSNYENSCIITPKVKKMLKGYDVFYHGDGLFEVSSRTPMVDETGQGFRPNGCFDENGNTVVPVKYWNIRYIGDGIFIVSKRTNQGIRFGLLDTKGNEIAPIEYELISSTTPVQNTYGKIYTMDFLQ